MKLSVEISMYPLAQPYVPAIERFIERLRAYPELFVHTHSMSTEVSGDYDRLFDVLRDEMRRSHEEAAPVVFVTKLIPGGTARRESP